MLNNWTWPFLLSSMLPSCNCPLTSWTNHGEKVCLHSFFTKGTFCIWNFIPLIDWHISIWQEVLSSSLSHGNISFSVVFHNPTNFDVARCVVLFHSTDFVIFNMLVCVEPSYHIDFTVFDASEAPDHVDIKLLIHWHIGVWSSHIQTLSWYSIWQFPCLLIWKEDSLLFLGTLLTR